MKAMVLRQPRPVEEEPLEEAELPSPSPGPEEIRIAVSACGICHTDLHLYYEKTVRTVTNSTREDARELLRLTAEIPLHTQVEVFPLAQANEALRCLKEGKIQGAGVLQITVPGGGF